MSHRPIQAKKIRKLERALRKAGAPAASIDLIDWLKTRGHAQTTGAAVRLLLDGKVRVESHIVGRQQVPSAFQPDKEVWGIAPLIGAHHRSNIRVDD
jgi:hypothetical protein